ncbi:MAG: sugar nucleotide-binding protein, partial [Spirochaetota bacterium]
MIWLIGCSGMLGREIAGIMNYKKMSFIGTDRECDITDIDALRSYARNKDITWIINCSAYTAVDKAEEEESLA